MSRLPADGHWYQIHAHVVPARNKATQRGGWISYSTLPFNAMRAQTIPRTTSATVCSVMTNNEIEVTHDGRPLAAAAEVGLIHSEAQIVTLQTGTLVPSPFTQ